MNSIFYAFIFTLYDQDEYKLILYSIGIYFAFPIATKRKGEQNCDDIVKR